MHAEHSQVVLNTALPALDLEPGDVGVVIHVHGQGEAYEVEFMTIDGRTIGVETVQAQHLRAASGGAVAHERERTTA